MSGRKPAVELLIFKQSTQEMLLNGEPVAFFRMKNPLPIDITEKQSDDGKVVSLDGKILAAMYVTPEQDHGAAFLSALLRDDPRPAETALKEMKIYRQALGLPYTLFGYGKSRDKMFRLVYSFERGGLLRTEMSGPTVEHVNGGQPEVALQINSLFKLAKDETKAISVINRLAWHVGRPDYTIPKMRQKFLKANAWGEDDNMGVNGLLTESKEVWPDLPVMILIATLLNIYDNLHA